MSAPATRPAAHWDVTFTETLSTGATRAWTLHVGDSFTDVPRAHWAYPYVERLLHGGVTTGCPGNRVYCPNDTVPREQMAAFLARGMAGDDASVPAAGSIPGVGDYTCGAGGVSRFTDVPADAWYCRHAHYIWAQDVTTGCDPVNHRFCPADVVPRDQMAVFVARVAAGGEDAVPESYTDPGTGRGYDCGAAGGSHFLDVDDQQWACAHVNYLWALGQIDGCDGPNRLFCPAPNVRRDEMAKFLSNAFGLGLGE
ncbi:MAG: S-layer homology domain-containing protein [Thermoanaerobaculaceae bacterium]